MAFDPISAALGVGELLIKRIWPDPTQQAEALRKMRELEQTGELAALEADVRLAMGQIEVNKIEAAGGWFRAGWRPFVGWCCGFALAYKFMIQPFAVAAVQIGAYMAGAAAPFPIAELPVIEWSELSVVLMGLLGLGTMRTYEKRTKAD